MLKFGAENDIHDLFMISASEGEDNCISFVVAPSYLGEPVSDPDDLDIPGLNDILRNCSPVYPDMSKAYEITFERYIFYLVRNESFCSYDDYEIRHGDALIIFSRSRLLDALPVLTNCCHFDDGSSFPGEWKHYGIYCWDHIIDIISCNEPIIKELFDDTADC